MKSFRYAELSRLLREEIKRGRWQPSERLPSVRQLCVLHDVSKATVLHALHQLEAENLIVARPKSGYFVQRPETEHPQPKRIETPSMPCAVTVPAIFRDIMTRSAAFDIYPAAGPGETENHLLTLNRCLGKALRSQPDKKATYYNEPAGDLRLREALSQHYRHRGIESRAMDYCITSGCQHALFLALMATCSPGDTVAVESPAFYGVLQIMEQLKLKIIEISSDPETGLQVDELEQKIAQWPIKACVVTPNFSTPTGSMMSEEAKKQLVKLACRHDFCVIEDDIYGDLAFASVLATPLKHFDIDDRIILCGSFSKSLSRDLRLGWVMGGKWHNAITQLKLITQLASSQSVQQGVAAFMEEGHYRRYLHHYVQRLKRQRDDLITLLQSGWKEHIRFTQASGGLSMWVEMDESVDTQKAYNDILSYGIILTPGPLFSASGLYKNYLRLSFAQPVTERRETAFHTLFAYLLTGR